jgi:hypothetical protein
LETWNPRWIMSRSSASATPAGTPPTGRGKNTVSPRRSTSSPKIVSPRKGLKLEKSS